MLKAANGNSRLVWTERWAAASRAEVRLLHLFQDVMCSAMRRKAALSARKNLDQGCVAIARWGRLLQVLEQLALIAVENLVLASAHQVKGESLRLMAWKSSSSVLVEQVSSLCLSLMVRAFDPKRSLCLVSSGEVPNAW